MEINNKNMQKNFKKTKMNLLREFKAAIHIRTAKQKALMKI